MSYPPPPQRFRRPVLADIVETTEGLFFHKDVGVYSAGILNQSPAAGGQGVELRFSNPDGSGYLALITQVYYYLNVWKGIKVRQSASALTKLANKLTRVPRKIRAGGASIVDLTHAENMTAETGSLLLGIQSVAEPIINTSPIGVPENTAIMVNNFEADTLTTDLFTVFIDWLEIPSRLVNP